MVIQRFNFARCSRSLNDAESLGCRTSIVLTRSVADILEEIRRPLLSEVDWIIVEMAKRDGPLSLNPDGIWARVSRHVFGLRVPGRLSAHPQEALRRFALRAWFWNLIRAGDMRELIEAGYSDV